MNDQRVVHAYIHAQEERGSCTCMLNALKCKESYVHAKYISTSEMYMDANNMSTRESKMPAKYIGTSESYLDANNIRTSIPQDKI